MMRVLFEHFCFLTFYRLGSDRLEYDAELPPIMESTDKYPAAVKYVVPRSGSE